MGLGTFSKIDHYTSEDTKSFLSSHKSDTGSIKFSRKFRSLPNINETTHVTSGTCADGETSNKKRASWYKSREELRKQSALPVKTGKASCSGPCSNPACRDKKCDQSKCGDQSRPLCVSCCPPVVRCKAVRVSFDAKAHPSEVRKGLKSIEARLAGYTHKQRLVVFCQLLYEDGVGAISAKWKLYCVTKKKSGSVTKRLVGRDVVLVYPGNMCAYNRLARSYFTVPSQNAIYTFQNMNKINVAFRTTSNCFGIAPFANGLAVSIEGTAQSQSVTCSSSSSSDWSIQFYDIRGNHKKTLRERFDGKPLFLEPMYLASNKTENVLFVSDRRKYAVIAINISGQVLFECQTFSEHAGLMRPGEITADNNENVYVECGKRVIQVNKDGTSAQDLLKIKERTDQVLGVCYDDTKNLLIAVQVAQPSANHS